MKGTKAASRYAKALLELAIEKNLVGQVSNDMNYLAEVSADNRDFELFLSSPVIKTDKKISVFEELFGQFEEITMLFVKQVAKAGRESLLPGIAASFEMQVKEYKGIVPVQLISATKLNDKTRNMILDKVSASVKGELEIKEIIDESLIGGFIVKMGDQQIDASIASQFNNLKQRLTK
jgi:F-type H+-transporting ATPase subunit delta